MAGRLVKVSDGRIMLDFTGMVTGEVLPLDDEMTTAIATIEVKVAEVRCAEALPTAEELKGLFNGCAQEGIVAFESSRRSSKRKWTHANALRFMQAKAYRPPCQCSKRFWTVKHVPRVLHRVRRQMVPRSAGRDTARS